VSLKIDSQIDMPNFTRFIEEYDAVFGGGLRRRLNASRVVSLFWFKMYAEEFTDLKRSKCAVVSGSSNEPELRFSQSAQVDFINFSDDNAFDLSKPWENKSLGGKYLSYDLVLCNQVLEHVFNPIVAFDNLTKLVRPKGYLYISVPVLNCIHGEPYFYSSGYHPRFLLELAQNSPSKMKTEKVGIFGSKRYMISAVLGKWLTVNEMFDGTSGEQINSWDNLQCDSRCPTDTWALFSKQTCVRDR